LSPALVPGFFYPDFEIVIYLDLAAPSAEKK
jgi:hypothetical protein